MASSLFTSADEYARHYGASSDKGSFSLNSTAFSLSTAGAIVFIMGFMIACDTRDATKSAGVSLHFPANIFAPSAGSGGQPQNKSSIDSTFKYIRNTGVALMFIGALLMASSKIPMTGSDGKALYILITYMIAIPLTLAFTAFATQWAPGSGDSLKENIPWVSLLVFAIAGSMAGMSVMFSMDPDDPHKKIDGSKLGITLSASGLMVVSVIGMYNFRFTKNMSMFGLFVPLFVISWLMFALGGSLDN